MVTEFDENGAEILSERRAVSFRTTTTKQRPHVILCQKTNPPTKVVFSPGHPQAGGDVYSAHNF